MINFDPSKLSFALLDKEQNIPEPVLNEDAKLPLPRWYRSVREMPLSELSAEDVSKACRQNIHIEYSVPLAIELLKEDPTAGEMFDGEVLVSLKNVQDAYWE